MAINVGSRPEQMLRGVDRAVAVLADAIPQLPSRSRSQSRGAARWLIERGTTRIQFPVNVLGGFPGSLRSMNRLEQVDLVLSVRYLVAGEGTPNGFAIPIRDILAASVVRPHRRANEGLRIWYRDGQRTGSFFIDVRGLVRGVSGLRRAEQGMQFLLERGVTPVETDVASRTPALFIPWEEAGEFAGQEMLWAGNGTGAIGGWFGCRRDHCRIWVTDESLLWAGARDTGVHRIALVDIIEARDGFGDGVCIGIADGLGHRFDLAFDLAPDYPEADRQASPRVRFMNVLAAKGVPVASASAPLAPWRAARKLSRSIGSR